MLNYIIYAIILAILVFVIIIAFKAINRGIEAKHNLNNNIDYDEKKKMNIKKDIDTTLTQELNNLKKLHSEGALSDEEFKKAKEKILF
tara:strand:+ start:710 stop:973 length:264 start_codon:yes stop_codon:yes gene_type:complete